jgi:hypothetical protein
MVPQLLSAAILTGVIVSAPTDADRALMKAIEPGPLGEYFTIISVRRGDIDPSGGELIRFRLKAKKELDLEKLPVFRFGFFDKSNRLHVVDDLRIELQFVLKAGESINAEIYHHENDENRLNGRPFVRRDWHRVVVQKKKRPRRDQLRDLLRELSR